MIYTHEAGPVESVRALGHQAAPAERTRIRSRRYPFLKVPVRRR